MSNEFVSAHPSTFVDRGFLTGRTLTIGGVRAVATNFNGKLKDGSTRVGMQFFFTEEGRDGEKRILSGFPYLGAWGDQLAPADNLKGLVPVAGADRPFLEKSSELALFNAALTAAGCPAKLQMGNYQKLVGMEVVLEAQTMPEIRRKKSVDPDEASAPAKPRTIEVVSKIVTLPADNADYKALTEKEMTAHLAEKADKSAARRAAAGEDAPAVVSAEDDDEPKPTKKAAKKAPVVEDEDDDEEVAAPAAGGFSDDDDEDEDEDGDDDAAASDPAAALASKLILQVLKAEKKVKGSALLQKVHPLLVGTEKKLVAKVLPLVQSPPFIASIPGVTVKGNMVVLG